MYSKRADRWRNGPPPNDVAVCNARDESQSSRDPLRMASPLLQTRDLLQRNPETLSHCDSKASDKANDAALVTSSTIRRIATTKIMKQLRFNPTVRGIFFEPPTIDQKRIWYSPDECRVFRETAQADARLLRYPKKRMREENPHVPLAASDQAALDATPIRCIEQFKSKNIFAGRCHQQRAAIYAVLAEQQRQRAQGQPPSSLGRQYEINKLALVSSTHSFETRQRALVTGQHCADEVLHEL